jgi:hypothetical protein
MLGDCGVGLAAGPSEVVEGDVEPLVDALMDCVVFIADCPRSASLFQRFHLGGSAVFVSAANEEHVVPHHAAEASVYVS